MSLSTDPEELARIKQRQFYLDMAERFTKMADEYDAVRYSENPLPIHGFTAVMVAHGEQVDDLSKEVSIMANDLPVEMARRKSMDMHGGKGSLRIEEIKPGQTEASYTADLEWWSKTMKARRDLKK